MLGRWWRATLGQERPANVPVFSGEGQREREARAAAFVRCNTLLASGASIGAFAGETLPVQCVDRSLGVLTQRKGIFVLEPNDSETGAVQFRSRAGF